MHFLAYLLLALLLAANPRMHPSFATTADPPDGGGGTGPADPPDGGGGTGAIDPPDNQGGG